MLDVVRLGTAAAVLVLLLGPGAARAQAPAGEPVCRAQAPAAKPVCVDVDGATPPAAVLVGVEAMPPAVRVGDRMAHPVELHNGEEVVVRTPAPPLTASSDSLVIRFDLEGAVFRKSAVPVVYSGRGRPQSGSFNGPPILRGGKAGDSMVIFGALPKNLVPQPEHYGVKLETGQTNGDGVLGVLDGSEGGVTATFRIYRSLEAARNGEASSIRRSGVVVRKVRALAADIEAGAPVRLDADSGYARFAGADGPVGWVALGTVGVRPRPQAGGAAVRDPLSGALVVPPSGAAGAGMTSNGRVNHTVTQDSPAGAEMVGALASFGTAAQCAEYFAGRRSGGGPTGPSANPWVAKGAVGAGVAAADGGVEIHATRARRFCVGVDLFANAAAREPVRNAAALPEARFSIELFTPDQPAGRRGGVSIGKGPLAGFDRGGATARVGFLTTYPKYRQRLTVVNRGGNAVEMRMVFHAEEGTTAVARGPEVRAIPGGATAVYRADELVEIEGRNPRAAAEITFNAPAGSLSVSTTQVNLSDGGTDTVMWPVR